MEPSRLPRQIFHSLRPQRKTVKSEVSKEMAWERNRPLGLLLERMMMMMMMVMMMKMMMMMAL